MADIYCDLALATGTNAGTSWTNAYQGGAGLVTAAAAMAAGDTLWIKGQKSGDAASRSIDFSAGTVTNPCRVYGVKSATTATPPTASDLIPGFATGGATAAYADSDVPSLSQSGSALNITLAGAFRMYGVKLVAGNTFDINNAANRKMMDRQFLECHVEWNAAANSAARSLTIGYVSSSGINSRIGFESCRIRLGDSDDCIIARHDVDLFNCVIDSRSTYRNGIFYDSAAALSATVRMYGCDLSGLSGAIVDPTNVAIRCQLYGCRLRSSYTLAAGTKTNVAWEILSIGSQANPSLSASGSIQAFDYENQNGTIATTTSVVRTSGANDGGTGSYAWAITPAVNGTRDNLVSLATPWLAGWINGDGSSQNLTFYFANSGSGDYQDDEVAVEVWTPAETTSTVKLVRRSSAMSLLGTAANLTDDTSSDWGTGAGGKNAQKITVAVSPSYRGPVFARVHFSKNFSASPETLYFDPRIYGAASLAKGTFPAAYGGLFLGSPDPSGGVFVIED